MSVKTVPKEQAKPTLPVYERWISKPSEVAVAVMLMIVFFLLVYGFRGNTNKNPALSNKTTAPTQRLILKELGVQVNLPGVLSGTTYTISQASSEPTSVPVTLNLVLPSYTALANKCLGASASNREYYASLTKNTGLAPGGKTVLMQTNDFTITDFGPSIFPGTVCKNNADQKNLESLSKNLSSALKSAFKSAKKI